MALVEIDEVVKDYSLGRTTIRALKGMNLSIGKGEFTSIVGPSGWERRRCSI